jgi:serine/threonine protein kinase
VALFVALLESIGVNMASTSEYWVGSSIGEGSFGVVVYARHKTTKLDVAVKCMDKSSLKHRSREQALAVVQEQKLLKRLKECPYTVNLYASFHDAECVYLVTECCTGGTLNDVLTAAEAAVAAQPPPQSPTSAASSAKSSGCGWRAHYGLQLLEALGYLHGTAQIVHCDLKPDNILLTGAGRIKLADFGCAVDLRSQPPLPALSPPEADATTTTTTTATSAGSHKETSVPLEPKKRSALVRGTAAYSSPELLQGLADLITPATDLWSFGCVLHALVSDGGKSPFQSETEALTVRAIAKYCSSSSSGCTDESTSAKSERSAKLFPKNSPSEPEAFWRLLIVDLLHPKPMDRLGAQDATAATATAAVPSTPSDDTAITIYPSIRSSLVWKGVDLLKDPELLPPVPTWWKHATATDGTSNMKDGKEGWSAFLV